MADRGAIYTDKAIAQTAKELKKTYRQAQRELKKKLADFEERFAAKNAQMRQKLEDGKISEQDYKNWLTGQVFIRNQWQEKIRQVSMVMNDCNRQAVNMINDRRIDVFAENYNFMAFRGEASTGISFGVYNTQAVTRLLMDNPQMLPKWKIDEEKDYEWNEQKVNNIVRQGIIQGEGIREITDRLCSELSSKNERKMEMFARTAMTEAQNAGRQQQMNDAAEMGIEINKQWLATLDSRTRDSHRHMDGEEVPYNEDFSNGLEYPGDPSGDPAEVYNCFVGDNCVAVDCNIEKSFKHLYSGDLFTIKTSAGVEFTCTPNHPILTPNGWIHAKSLNNGDDIFVARISNNVLSGIDPNVDHAFPRIEAIHEFSDEFTRKRICGLRVNFHGDVPTSDVEVVAQKRFLRNNGDSRGTNSVNKFLLKLSDKPFVSQCSFMKHFRCVCFSSLGRIGSKSKFLSFLKGSVFHPRKHGLRTVSYGNSTFSKPQNDSITSNVKFFSEGFDRFPGNVFVDKIIDINISSAFHVPVYNLQTKNGYYYVNTIISGNQQKDNGIFAIAHNCRCTMVSIYPKYEDRSKPDWREEETVDGMTYQEWKKGKEQEGQIGEPKPVDGIDLTGSWTRREGKFDFEIEDVMEAQGFDGRPRVVSREEFEKAVQESGFIAQRTYSAPDQETLDEYQRMLYYGKWYVDCSEGGAQYGQGMYCAASWTGKLTKGIIAEMEHYQELARKKANSEVTTWGGMKVMSPIKGSQKTVVSRVETITLAPDAKVITYKELVRMRQEEKEKALSTMTEEQYMAWKEKQPGDIGAYAAMKGYDAINAEGHGESGSYTVILNRTKCIILGD